MQKQHPWNIPAALFLGVAVWYVLTMPHNFSAAHDSMEYLTEIESGFFFHPHHLLYNAVAALWLAVIRMVPGAPMPATAIQLLNILFGAGSVVMVYLLFRRRFGIPDPPATLLALLPASSFGLWFYSSTIEVYIIPLFFLLGSLYLITIPSISRGHVRMAGLAHAAAVLFHQAHVLFGAAILWNVFARRELTFRNRLTLVREYLFVAVPIVAIPYLVIPPIYHHTRTVGDYLYWLTSYAHTSSFWTPLTITLPAKMLVGLGRAFIGGHFMFALGSVTPVIKGMLSSKSLNDELFLVRTMEPAAALLLTALSVLCAGMVVAGFVYAAVTSKPVMKSRRVLFSTALVWLVVYSAFFLFWETTNLEFWIPQMVVCWLIFGAFAGERWRTSGRSLTAGATVLVMLLAGINYFGSMRYLESPDNDYYHVSTRMVSTMATPNDLVVAPSTWIYQSYIRQTTGATTIAPEGSGASPTTLRHDIARTLASGHRVFILNTVAEDRDALATFLDPGEDVLITSTDEGISQTWILSPENRDK